ncbi:MAG: hypothetical protein RLZ55_377, partial [Actinomycetota bacterium]
MSTTQSPRSQADRGPAPSPARPPLWQRFWRNELHFQPGRPAVRMRVITYILVGVLAVFGLRLLQVQ